MSKETGGAAFPREDYQTEDAPGQRGMTLRDYFAAKAMQAIAGREEPPRGGDSYELVAQFSYAMADAMLAARAA